jgi:hypothetical protein
VIVFNRSMNLLGEPDDDVYRLTKAGTLALFEAVNAVDTKGTVAKTAKAHPCEAVVAYLDAAFLGSFLRSGQAIPYMANAGVLGTYIDFLDYELETGALHATPVHQAYLKLLAYVTAIEVAAPLELFGNSLEYLAGERATYDCGIYYELPSANKKLEKVSSTLKRVQAVPKPFLELHARLKTLIDPVFRNAIAHATYRVHSDQQRVEIWNRGELVQTRTFEQVDEAYRAARSYLQGFVAGVSDFADRIHPDCPFAWHP